MRELEIVDLYRHYRWREQTGIASELRAIARCRRFVVANAPVFFGEGEVQFEKIKTQAMKVYKSVKDQTLNEVAAGVRQLELLMLAQDLVPLREHARAMDGLKSLLVKDMVALAKTLPYAEWWAGQDGLAIPGLALVIGAAGRPLPDYRDHSALWKRFGLGLVGEERQRKCKDAEKALAHGYDPIRRSMIWRVAQAAIFAGKRKDSRLYQTYAAEKTKQEELHPELKPIVRHMRAHRYVAKRILRDLYREATR